MFDLIVSIIEIIYFNTQTKSLSLSVRSNVRISNRRRHKIISKRQIITLITINISFCILSMPMVILQIVYYLHVNSRITESTHLNNLVYMMEHEMDLADNDTNTVLVNQQEKSKSMDELVDLMHAVAELLQYLNHGSNFILYVLSGNTFRKETKSIFFIFFKWMKKKLF